MIVQTVLLTLLSLFNFSFPSRVIVIVIKFIFPFYKDIQAEVTQHFKNILRTYSGGELVKKVFILYFLCGKFK